MCIRDRYEFVCLLNHTILLAIDITSSIVQLIHEFNVRITCTSNVRCYIIQGAVFFKSRSETTAFDQHYFRGRLNTNDDCQQVLRTKHRRVFRRFSCPFAAVWTMLSGEFGQAEFLGRRLEGYQHTLGVYGRVAFQETQLTQGMECLIQVIGTQLESLATLYSDHDRKLMKK